MSKLAFTFLSCSLLNCAFALDITKANNSFAWHKHAITQKISCIEKHELETKFNSDKNSAPIARLIALTRLGLPTNAKLQSLDISGLDDKYIELMQANNIGDLANIIGKDKIQSWSINDENDTKKLNTFFGFACAINARTQNKTFSKTYIDETVDQTIDTLNLSKFTLYKNTVKRNLWNAFNSWEIHALDHVLREEKDHTIGIQNGSRSECFNNTAQQNIICMKTIHKYITDISKNKAHESDTYVKQFSKRVFEAIKNSNSLEKLQYKPAEVLSAYDNLKQATTAYSLFSQLINQERVDSLQNIKAIIEYSSLLKQLEMYSKQSDKKKLLNQAQRKKTSLEKENKWLVACYQNCKNTFTNSEWEKAYEDYIYPFLNSVFYIESLCKDSEKMYALIAAEQNMISDYCKYNSTISTNRHNSGSLSNEILKNIPNPNDPNTSMVSTGQDDSARVIDTVIDSIKSYLYLYSPTEYDNFVEDVCYKASNQSVSDLSARVDISLTFFNGKNEESNTDVQVAYKRLIAEANGKYRLLDKAPKYLYINIQRGGFLSDDGYGLGYSSNSLKGMKNSIVVNNILNCSSKSGKRYKYILRSAGCKSGAHTSGHWTAIKRNQASFKIISDSSVSISDYATATKKLSEEAQYVFYERLDEATF